MQRGYRTILDYTLQGNTVQLHRHRTESSMECLLDMGWSRYMRWLRQYQEKKVEKTKNQASFPLKNEKASVGRTGNCWKKRVKGDAVGALERKFDVFSRSITRAE